MEKKDQFIEKSKRQIDACTISEGRKLSLRKVMVTLFALRSTITLYLFLYIQMEKTRIKIHHQEVF